jgi:uncharacterized phage protein gp47/JayE
VSEQDDLFKQMLAAGNVPTTQAELDAAWDAEVSNSDITINNSSSYSPFARTVKALITTPMLWLMGAMVTSILPNLFIKTAVGVWLDLLAWVLDLTRQAATKTLGTIEFARVDSSGTLDIPLGRVIQTQAINGVVYQVITTEAKSFADAEAVITITVEAVLADETLGAGHNLAAGYFNALLEPISGVSVTNLSNWITTAGSDQESDENFRLRCKNQFSALNQYHTDAVYTALITTFAGIGVNNVFFDSDAPRGAGTADAYILMNSGEPSAQLLTDIEAHIMDDGNHGHGDDMQIKAMPAVNSALVMNIWFTPNLSIAQKTQLASDAEQFVRAAFRENTNWPASQTLPHATFSFSLLSQELHNEFGGLASVEFDLTDIATALAVARLSGLTVNVN